MKTNMTERDKKLLVGMFIGVIIVAIGYWGILPQVKQYRALAEKIEKEENIKKLNKAKQLNVGTIQAQADNYEQKIAERRDEFYPIMSSSEIDRMMTEMAVNKNLNIYDLNFSMPKSPTERLAYKNSSLYNWQVQAMSEYVPEEPSTDDDLLAGTDLMATSSKSESDIMIEAMGGEEGGYQPNTDIYAVPVTITVGGDVYNLEQFIDEINTLDKRVLLLGYSWGEFRDIVRRDSEGNIISSSSSSSTTTEETVSSDENSDTTVEIITRKSLTVRLEIYMCDTSDVTVDSESETVEETVEETTDTESGE